MAQNNNKINNKTNKSFIEKQQQQKNGEKNKSKTYCVLCCGLVFGLKHWIESSTSTLYQQSAVSKIPQFQAIALGDGNSQTGGLPFRVYWCNICFILFSPLSSPLYGQTLTILRTVLLRLYWPQSGAGV